MLHAHLNDHEEMASRRTHGERELELNRGAAVRRPGESKTFEIIFRALRFRGRYAPILALIVPDVAEGRPGKECEHEEEGGEDAGVVAHAPQEGRVPVELQGGGRWHAVSWERG